MQSGLNTHSRAVDGAGAGLLAVALLLPVGDAPWISFWREWTAAVAVWLIVLGAVSTLRDLGLPLQMRLRSLPAAAMALAALCWVQFAAGLLPRHSDALMPSLYFAGFALCWMVAAALPLAERDALADRLALAFLAAALLSAPLALLQWLGWATLDLGLKVSGGRPVAHMEQANLLCSLMLQGLMGLWRMVERRRIGLRVGTVLAVPLVLASVLTQSRVAWLVGAALLWVCLAQRRRPPWRTPARVVVGMVVVVAIGMLLLPWFDSHVGVPGASLAERTSAGRRPMIWGLFLDAVRVHPWAGWGALQNGAAQYALADNYSSAGWYFSSAHNIVIDLMVWFGAPVGLAAGGALLLVTARRVTGAPNAAAQVSGLAAAALVLHALVELPLQYAYFLLPLGLLLGAGAAESAGARPAPLRLSAAARGLLPSLALAPALVLALLASDYIRLSDVRPVLALDMATRHSTLSAEFAPPEIVLLDQLRAFHEFSALPLRPELSPAQLASARAAMLRAPSAPSIERYALLTGIHGRTADASDALRRLCKFESTPSCDESQRVWALWQVTWPQLPPWPQSALPR